MVAAPLPKINPELEALLPRPNDEMLEGLKSKIIRDGVREPIFTAEDGDIVDGYSRFVIYQELKIKFPIQVIKNLHTLADKKRWMRDHQIFRRNLTPTEFAYHLGMKYEEEKNENPKGSTVPHSEVRPPQESTAERLARETNTSPATVDRAAEFARAVEQQPAKVRSALVAGALAMNTVTAAAAQDAPLFCPRCTRVGPVKGCAKCALVQLAFRKKKAKAAPKKGAVLVDWLGFEKALGVVVRLSDRICDAYPGEKHGTHQAEYEKAVARVVQLGKDWKKRLTAGGA